jgi:hypothetical protein
MDWDEIEQIQESFPFLSGVRKGEDEFICIIQNADDKIMSFYDFEAIVDEHERQLFLEFGEIWWWESNRQLPINIFLQGQMDSFKFCLRTINLKDVDILFGPVTSLNDLFKKRIKRRQIQLVKK